MPSSPMRAFLVLTTFLATGCFAACSSDDPEPTETVCTPDAASIERDVFGTSCLDAGCHDATDRAGDLDLATPGAADALVRRIASTCPRSLVIPGDPDGSFLLEKIADDQPECGARMPVGAPLDPELVACVRDWIADLDDVCETCDGETCIDTDSDAAHCGGCDNPCPADASCEGGSCVCSDGDVICAGTCVDTMSSPTHCGGCDAPCDGMLVCSLGSCKAGCDGNLTACDGACVDTMTDPDFCGDCVTSCGPDEVCMAGECTCPGGADTTTDPDNCGACGNQCAPGQACEGGECTCASSSVSYAADIQPIFEASCVSNACHGGVMPSASLDLRAGASHGELVSVPSTQCASRLLVAPGDAPNSYLVHKLLGQNLCFGTKMPKMGSLPPGDLVAISSWICDGAPNN